MVISKHSDITLTPSDYNSYNSFEQGNTKIKQDWFDFYMLTHEKVDIYKIINKENNVGYISLYDWDKINHSICIYPKISETRYYVDMLKAVLSVLEYCFKYTDINKVILKYRNDNYFFDDMCRFLHFIKEGTLRENLLCSDGYVNINIYSMLKYEYTRYNKSDFLRMFTWEYNYSPSSIININIDEILNLRAFTNSLDNPNHALMNDSFKEFSLNRELIKDNFLTYHDIKFPVYIFDMKKTYDSFTCRGQTVDVPAGKYKDILLVITAQFGYKETYLELSYADGTSDEIEFTISDWCERVLRDEYIIYYAYGCRKVGGNSNIIKCDSFLYLKRIRIPLEKELLSLKFPDNQDIIVFSVALAG